jgi:hypothetical protein
MLKITVFQSGWPSPAQGECRAMAMLPRGTMLAQPCRGMRAGCPTLHLPRRSPSANAQVLLHVPGSFSFGVDRAGQLPSCGARSSRRSDSDESLTLAASRVDGDALRPLIPIAPAPRAGHTFLMPVQGEGRGDGCGPRYAEGYRRRRIRGPRPLSMFGRDGPRRWSWGAIKCSRTRRLDLTPTPWVSASRAGAADRQAVAVSAPLPAWPSPLTDLVPRGSRCRSSPPPRSAQNSWPIHQALGPWGWFFRPAGVLTW